MNDDIEETAAVTRSLITAEHRLSNTAKLFAAHFPMVIEPVVYGVTERMAEDSQGGYWAFLITPRYFPLYINKKSSI